MSEWYTYLLPGSEGLFCPVSKAPYLLKAYDKLCVPQLLHVWSCLWDTKDLSLEQSPVGP